MTLKICNSQQPRGSLLERPSETLDGRPTPAVKNKEGFLPCKAAKEPWKQKALRLAVGLLFLPAEAIKELLERKPGQLLRWDK